MKRKYLTIKEESIIGKKYYPKDNSYCVNLTTCSNYPYRNDTSARLAGTQIGDMVKECTIISEPFDCIITRVIGGTESEKMILVNYNNCTYSIMYFEDSVQ